MTEEIFLTYSCRKGDHSLCNGNKSECLPHLSECQCACHKGITEINFYSRKVEYGWLSNFWRAKQRVDGFEYPTNEHFYQSQKAIWPQDAEVIRRAEKPRDAMTMGRSLKMIRPDWEQIKVGVMHTGLRAKFNQNPDLREKLLATGNAIIHEDSPTDMFWGKLGKDMLGKLLMAVREELRNAQG